MIYIFQLKSPINTGHLTTVIMIMTIFLLFQNIAQAQYNSVLNNYSVDWSKAGVPNGIPNLPNTVNVLDYGAQGDGSTTNNNLTAFHNALSAAGYGGVVFVPTGTYFINGSIIMPEGRVLRGECPNNTILKFNISPNTIIDPPGCIDIATPSQYYDYGDFEQVSAGFTKGSTSITVNNPAVFSAGDFLEIEQDNDPVLMYTQPIGAEPPWNQPWAQEAVGQYFVVTKKSGNTIYLDRPIFYGFNPALNPRARRVHFKTDVGIENLYIVKVDNSDRATIKIKNAARCWVRNVNSYKTYKAHVAIARAMDCEVRDSYFFDSHDHEGGYGYGVTVVRHATSILVENNIFKRLRHSMLLGVGATGNVFGYNYSTAPYWYDNATTANDPPPCISMHGHFVTMNLFEGNIVQEATFSDHWGPVGPGNTMFRNRVETDYIRVSDHSHHQNVIANELAASPPENQVDIDPSVQNTWFHSNINVDNSIPDGTVSVPLPPSLYHTLKPDFLEYYAFPTLGPGTTFGAGSIPAKDRYDSGNYMLYCACNSSVCFETCPPNITNIQANANADNIPGGIYEAINNITTSGVVVSGTSAVFTAGNSITLTTGFMAEEGSIFLAFNDGCGGGGGTSGERLHQEIIESENDENEPVSLRNYPNPFTGQTTIEYTLSNDSPVTLFVSDVTGKKIAMLLSSDKKDKGTHSITFDGSNYPPGMYYYTIQVSEKMKTKKMILAK